MLNFPDSPLPIQPVAETYWNSNSFCRSNNKPGLKPATPGTDPYQKRFSFTHLSPSPGCWPRCVTMSMINLPVGLQPWSQKASNSRVKQARGAITDAMKYGTFIDVPIRMDCNDSDEPDCDPEHHQGKSQSGQYCFITNYLKN